MSLRCTFRRGAHWRAEIEGKLLVELEMGFVRLKIILNLPEPPHHRIRPPLQDILKARTS